MQKCFWYGTVLGGPCWVWSGPGESVAHPGWSGVVRDHPCWHRVGSGMVRGRSGTVRSAGCGGPGSSVLAPCWSVVLPCWVRVDDVFRPSVISRGTVEAFSPRFTPDQGISWSGVFRGYPGWSVLGPALVWLRFLKLSTRMIRRSRICFSYGFVFGANIYHCCPCGLIKGVGLQNCV